MADSPKTEMPPSGEDYYHISTDVKVTPVNRFYYRATPPWVWWIKRAIQSDAWNGRHAKDAEWLIIAFKAGLQWIPVVTVCTSEALMDPPSFLFGIINSYFSPREKVLLIPNAFLSRCCAADTSWFPSDQGQCWPVRNSSLSGFFLHVQ